MSLRRRQALLVAAAVLGASAAGCSSDEPSARPSPSPTSAEASTPAPSPTTPKPEGPVEDVTFADGAVTPQAKRIKTTVGETVVLRVSSDTVDELHVHSTPEQTFEVKTGMEDEPVEITIDRPGQVAVESHDLGVVVVQLVVEP